VVGLLSSSCCALQLILNTLSFGCAGFNTVLGPLRPHLLAVTVLLQGFMWRAALASRSKIPSAIAASVTTIVLALLPEALYWSMHVREDLQNGRTEGANNRLDSEVEQDVINLVVGGMGCTACTVKVKAAIEALEGVSACSIDFETGRASVVLAPVNPEPSASAASAGITAAVKREAIAAVRNAGFSAEDGNLKGRPTA
jgi:copper chaperone CopZ